MEKVKVYFDVESITETLRTCSPTEKAALWKELKALGTVARSPLRKLTIN
jgi:hypothetical protein